MKQSHNRVIGPNKPGERTNKGKRNLGEWELDNNNRVEQSDHDNKILSPCWRDPTLLNNIVEVQFLLQPLCYALPRYGRQSRAGGHRPK